MERSRWRGGLRELDGERSKERGGWSDMDGERKEVDDGEVD
jgi:hypothetical protein